jgi:hypothetical protein
MTRRELALAAAPAAALAQTDPAKPETAEDLLAAARTQIRNNSAALAKYKIETALEPAFQFKA